MPTDHRAVAGRSLRCRLGGDDDRHPTGARRVAAVDGADHGERVGGIDRGGPGLRAGPPLGLGPRRRPLADQEVLPFWGSALLGLLWSTLLVGLAGRQRCRRTPPTPPTWRRSGRCGWLRFLWLDRLVFAPRSHSRLITRGWIRSSGPGPRRPGASCRPTRASRSTRRRPPCRTSGRTAPRGRQLLRQVGGVPRRRRPGARPGAVLCRPPPRARRRTSRGGSGTSPISSIRLPAASTRCPGSGARSTTPGLEGTVDRRRRRLARRSLPTGATPLALLFIDGGHGDEPARRRLRVMDAARRARRAVPHPRRVPRPRRRWPPAVRACTAGWSTPAASSRSAPSAPSAFSAEADCAWPEAASRQAEQRRACAPRAFDARRELASGACLVQVTASRRCR